LGRRKGEKALSTAPRATTEHQGQWGTGLAGSPESIDKGVKPVRRRKIAEISLGWKGNGGVSRGYGMFEGSTHLVGGLRECLRHDDCKLRQAPGGEVTGRRDCGNGGRGKNMEGKKMVQGGGGKRKLL